MTKQQFLSELESHLAEVNEAEREDILRDQEEYIREATNLGRSEMSVIEALGSPRALAATLKAEMKISRATQSTNLSSKFKLTISAVVAALALAPLNFLFLLGPFLAVCVLLFTGWTLVVTFGATSIALFIALAGNLSLIPWAPFGHMAGFSFLLGSMGLIVLCGMVLWVLTKWGLDMFLGYLNWNMNFVKKQIRE
ncbi:DUF1700 domain-containing protein [bacterium]|nr:DUF1700 domain-containing protein [bacterium]